MILAYYLTIKKIILKITFCYNFSENYVTVIMVLKKNCTHIMKIKATEFIADWFSAELLAPKI